MPVDDWIPSVDEVGALLRTRTRDSNGEEIGTFDDTTKPTGVQVASKIVNAAGDLASAVGTEDIPEAFWLQAGGLVVYRAAMLVELTYFPEQVVLGRSPYTQLKELYDEGLKVLRKGMQDAGGDVPGNAEGADAAPPAYAFPAVPTALDALLGTPQGGPMGSTIDMQPWAGGLYQ